MATKKPVSQKNTSSQEVPIPKQSKIIGLVLLVGFVGLSILWYVGKSKIQSIEASLDAEAKKYGFVLEKDPLEFSGFPFSLKATFPKFKAVMEEGRDAAMVMLHGEPVVVSPKPWNPSHVTIDGPLTYGVYHGGMPLMSLKAQTIKVKVSQDKNGEIELNQAKAYDVDVLKEGEKILSIKEVIGTRKSKEDGALTHIFSSLEGEGVEVAMTSASSIGIDKIGVSSTISSPYKTSAEATKAIVDFNQAFSRDIEKRCDEGAAHLPPLLETVKGLGATKSAFDFSFHIKGGEYGAKLDCKASVKDDFPEIKISLELKNADKFLDLAVESGAIATSVSRAVSLFLASVGKEESGVRHVTLNLEGREVKLGDRTIIDLKDTNLDEIALPVQYCTQIKAMAATQKKAAAGSLAGASPAI
jgi:hypothetical protein